MRDGLPRAGIFEKFFSAGSSSGTGAARAVGEASGHPDLALIQQSRLFDTEFYLAHCPDSSQARQDPIRHYLDAGRKSRTNPNLLFFGSWYLEEYADVANSGLDPLVHYLRHGGHEGRRANWLFDGRWYLDAYPDARESEKTPLEHYLTVGAALGYDPGPLFATEHYLEQVGDDAEARACPLAHYFSVGVGRGLSRHPDLAAGLETGVVSARLASAVFFSRFGFRFNDSSTPDTIGAAVRSLVLRRPRLRIDKVEPKVSVIIPVYGQVAYALNALEALADQDFDGSVEIIVADDMSPPETDSRELAGIPWIRYQRNTENLGFLKTCNAAAASARGEFLVLLNSDTRPLAGWLQELVDTFQVFPRAGLVGSKLLFHDGTLQEAGGIVWKDGFAWNFGRGARPADPRFSFARQVDYCSGASIAIRRDVWDRLGGFDDQFVPAYYEDTDLAFRVRQAGFEVWYQPASEVIHFEGVTHGRDLASGVKRYQAVNRRRFFERWAGVLAAHRPTAKEPDQEADRLAPPTVLVVDSLTPTPDQDSGSFMTVQIMKSLASLGYKIEFVPENMAQLPAYTAALQKIGVKCRYSPFDTSLRDCIRGRSDIEYVLVFRYQNMERFAATIREELPQARLVFHNVDLHHVRESRQASLKQDNHLALKAELTRAAELRAFLEADASIVHTEVERTLVQTATDLANLVVFPYTAPIVAARRDWSERQNVFFLGGFAHPPNEDAVLHFAREIWPLVADRLPEGAKFVVAGAEPTAAVRAIASERIEVLGHVPDLGPVFEAARVFVAPLRYGAGIKGKVVQAMAHGVPVVATGMAAEGMDVGPDTVVCVRDDAAAFAEAILELFEDEARWRRLQQEGYGRVATLYSAERAKEFCRSALEFADRVWAARLRRRTEEVIRERSADIRAIAQAVAAGPSGERGSAERRSQT